MNNYNLKYFSLFIILIFTKCLYASDSSYISNYRKVLSLNKMSNYSYVIIPIKATKDSTDGILLLSLDEFSEIVDTSINYSVHILDSFLTNEISYIINLDTLNYFNLRFISNNELLNNSNLLFHNCLLKGRRINIFHKLKYIDPTISKNHIYIWLWAEFLDGNYYQWGHYNGIFIRLE